jgi:CO dehydrogenase/acetyl-CoA synthase gamma subunit (corrinoid Fe-S protein)
MSKLKTVNIKGKEYVEVNERIKHFRSNYKDWSLSTSILELENTRCVIQATVFNENDRIMSTGIAYEIEGSSFINKTSFIENCETSAIGRALGNLGIGIDTSVASYEEVANAVKQQAAKPVVKEELSEEKFNAMLQAANEGKTNLVKSKMDNYKLLAHQEKALNTALNNK